jgi:predicted metalloprotease
MRFGGRRTSDNVESQSGGGFGGGGLGGGAGMLFGLVFSRFGIGGVVVLFIVLMLFGGNPLGLTGEQSGPAPQAQTEGRGATACSSDETRRFLCQVLASTEDKWTEMFREAGQTYTPATLVFFPGTGTSGCGVAQAAMGPFYCPSDRRIYLDTSFFEELASRFEAPGDFAQAYVVAHEVGHHVQTITGLADTIRERQSAVGRTQGNALQVRMELQADCLAGVWAARERNAALEPGDLEEGMRAAAAIGDDTLQRAGQGRVVPESFTHGSAAQRQEALMRGYNGGNPGACSAYTQGI